MSNKTVLTVVGAIIALGLGNEAVGEDKTIPSQTPQGGFEKCYGIAKAGKNDCGTGAGACSGQARVDNDKNSWIALPKGTCDKIVGGSTTAESTAK